MSTAYEEFMKRMINPMRDELTRVGFEEMTTVEDVEKFMENAKGTTLVAVNSVCGCSGGLARPAVTQALLNSQKKPDHLVTVFAGQDKEATAKMREYFEGYEPSSPSFALLNDKKVVRFVSRDNIEGSSMEVVMKNLIDAFETNC